MTSVVPLSKRSVPKHSVVEVTEDGNVVSDDVPSEPNVPNAPNVPNVPNEPNVPNALNAPTAPNVPILPTLPNETEEEPEEETDEEPDEETDEEPEETEDDPTKTGTEKADTIYMEKELSTDQINAIIARVIPKEKREYRFTLHKDDEELLRTTLDTIGLRPFITKGKFDVLLYATKDIPANVTVTGKGIPQTTAPIQCKLYFMFSNKKINDREKKYIRVYMFRSNYPALRQTIIDFFRKVSEQPPLPHTISTESHSEPLLPSTEPLSLKLSESPFESKPLSLNLSESPTESPTNSLSLNLSESLTESPLEESPMESLTESSEDESVESGPLPSPIFASVPKKSHRKTHKGHKGHKGRKPWKTYRRKQYPKRRRTYRRKHHGKRRTYRRPHHRKQ